ncbi:MAG: hypothetical protein ACPGVU_05090 [Limisphaerales bacterium]
MRGLLIFSLLLPGLVGANDAESIIRKAVPYLESNGVMWMQERKCVSCHQITSMLWGLNETAQTEIGFDRKKLEEWRKWAAEKMAAMEKDPKKKPPVDNIVKLMAGNYASKEFSEFANWTTKQTTNDHWKAGGQLPRQKRPARETDEVTTMWAIFALTPVSKEDKKLKATIRKARAWVTEGKPAVSTEWRVVSALTSRGKKQRSQRIKQLLDWQNDDGGWGWIGGKVSDALATGLALYGLAQSGISDTEAAVERARGYLAGSQREDGSWKVPSTKTANKGEPNPISNYWGTAWAVIGLASALDR